MSVPAPLTHRAVPTPAPQPEAFDALAADYDAAFTESRIGRAMRDAVWRRLDAVFRNGDRVLELGCGTGEDACHLAEHGIEVVALDRASAMVEHTREKARRRGLETRIEAHELAIEDVGALAERGPFDGVLSNFGALNCVADRPELARTLGALVRPGARALLCFLGRWAPWEWLWFAARGQPRVALRRMRRGGVVWRGLRVQYPPLRQLRRELAPTWRLERTAAVGALIPPSYAESWAARHPNLLARAVAWERRFETAAPMTRLADHVLIELTRR